MIGLTGSTGTLGSILKAKLEESNLPYSVYQGDIRNFKELLEWLTEHKIKILYHFAAMVPVDTVENNIPLAYDININGTIQLIKAIGALHQKIYVFYSSTSHIYESNPVPLTEEAIVNPSGTYGLTKLISENILRDYALKNKEMSLCIGRIFSFYHKTQKIPFLYPTLLQRFKEEDLGKPFMLRGAMSVRDFLNAEEVVDLILKLVSKQAQGVFNIGSGKGQRILDFLNGIAPQKLQVAYDLNEKSTYLVADITKLNQFLNA